VTSETGFDPALYERFPTRGRRPPGEMKALEKVWQAPRGWKLLTEVNNSYIGVFYVGGAFLFFLLAGLLALLIRAQLALPLNGVLPQETYNQVFTMHGTAMMFLFAVPAVEAMAVLLLPQLVGARDLPFPRLSAYAFWAYLVGGLCFFASILFGVAPNGGWFMYPPLTSKTFSPGINADLWLLGIGFIEISAIAGAIEIIVGVLKTRAPGMTLDRMPLFAWAMLIFGVMVIIGFPAIIAGTLLLELERALGWPFFDPLLGGDPILWQHLFWFFGHPEVYIIFLPAAGMLSMIVPSVARAPLVGYRLVVLALIATAFISFGVWAHHMFTTGLPTISLSFFSAASMAVAVPAGVQVFAWIGTVAAGRLRFNTPGLFIVGSLVTFVIGGLTGVMLAVVPFDWQAHDTYFIVAHLHYVLIGGMVFPLFAALYYWIPMTSRRALSERLGKWVFWLLFSGMQVTFFPMHLTGLMGMPRRVWVYHAGMGWELTNLISTVGAFMFGAGVAIFLFDLIRNFRFARGRNAGNLYGGGTLEWLPTGLYSARSIPVVRSRYPLWDDPELSKEVKRGRYFLPNTVFGRRETLVTSPLKAEPQYLQTLPGPSIWPMASAILTAGFFLLLVVQLYWLAVISGVGAVAGMLRWLWETDRLPPAPDADIGAGIRAPTYVAGPGSHGWWAMVILLVVLTMIFLMMVFSYVFLWSRAPHLWTDPPALRWLGLTAGAYAAAGALALGARTALRRGWRPIGVGAIFALSFAALALAWGVDIGNWWSHGLRPDASSHGATVFALLSFQGVAVAVVMLMTGFLLARVARHLLSAAQASTADLVTLFIGYAVGQGLVATLLPRLFPLVV